MTLSSRVASVLARAGVGRVSHLCVALSGGVDSTVLLHILAGCRDHFGYTLTAAHVHHGLSGNADDWCDFCGRLCASLDVPLQLFRVQVARDTGAGLEAAARAARYAALAAVEADWLVLGHHLDDQAETLLLRLLRGAGVRGAGSMRMLEPGRLRPLLAVRRREIEAYAHEARLDWVEDESNADPSFARNQLRHAVLPVLESAFPAAAVTLARAAAHFQEADALLDELAEIDQAVCGGALWNVTALQAMSDARLRNLLRWRIRQAGAAAPAAVRLSEALRQLRTSAGTSLSIDFGGMLLRVYRGKAWLSCEDETDDNLLPRLWQGESGLPWAGGAVRFDAEVGRGVSRVRLAAAKTVVLMARWPGLKMRQASRRPSRTFKNLCQEAAIPPWLRDRLPVFCIDGEAAWIAEIGVSTDFSSAPDEEGVLPTWLPVSPPLC